MLLTKENILLIMDLIAEKYGPGYCINPIEVGKLQAKLSIMLETRQRMEEREEWESLFPDPAELLRPFLAKEEKGS